MKFIEAPLYSQQTVIILAILALVFSIMDLFITSRICKKIWFKVLSIFSFIVSFVFIFLTMRGSYLYRVNRPVFIPSLIVIQWPFLFFLLIALLFFVLTIVLFIYAFIWGNQNLSSVSIKESIDKLPRGICFYEKSGLVRLFNEEMNHICILLTGNALLNGTTFFKEITEGKLEVGCKLIKSGDESIISCSNGKVFSFKRILHSLENEEIYELIATNITEEYALTKELEIELEKLKKVNKRLVSYEKSVSQLSREKEILAAKIRIHDNMGKLLLITKRKLSFQMKKEDCAQLLSFWKVEIGAIKNTQTTKKKSNLQVILEAAQLVNVKIELIGEYPSNDSLAEKVLIQAMHECLTNIVAHANGHLMKVVIHQKLDNYTIQITNDGTPPKEIIIEGGGLSSLRSLIERENGKMIVTSKPQFELFVELPRGGIQ